MESFKETGISVLIHLKKFVYNSQPVTSPAKTDPVGIRNRNIKYVQ
jgi:hypothetical protein